MATAPNVVVEAFATVEPASLAGQGAADQIAAAGYFGAKPPENAPITDTVTPVKQVANSANQ